MSAQLLICEFTVFTCISFFFFLPMPRVTRMARWLAVCQDPSLFCVNPTTHQKNMLMMMMTINLIYTQLKYQYNNRK